MQAEREQGEDACRGRDVAERGREELKSRACGAAPVCTRSRPSPWRRPIR